MSELKNCSFCGGEVEIKQEKMYGYWIGCPSCSIETSYMNKADAITAWNTRTASPRFTEVEREAMTYTIGELEYLMSRRSGQEHGVKLLSAIATVRKMLEGSA